MTVQRRAARRSRTWRVTVLAFVVAAAAASQAVQGADLFDEIFKQGQQKNGAMKTLTASFVETTTSALLVKPLTARGTVAVERPGRVALRYTDPDARTVVIDGDTMTVQWPSKGLEQAKDIGATQKRIQKYFVDSSPNELRSHFSVTARDAADRPGSYAILMVPKRKQIQEGLTKLELWVDKGTLLMSAMRMTFPNGDTKLMTFSDVKANVPLDPYLFKP